VYFHLCKSILAIEVSRGHQEDVMSQKKKKKQRIKKIREHKTGRVGIKADEVFQYGPITVARFGKYVQMTNNSTPEEHADFLKRARESHIEIIKELEMEVVNFQALIKQRDPLALMDRAAYMVLPLFIKHRSESEYSIDEVYALPSLEYIQYVIARTPFNAPSRPIDEEDWTKIWEKARLVIELTNAYLTTKPSKNNPPTEIDSLSHHINSYNLMVRVSRYPNFLADYWRTSLEPFDTELVRLYGISSADIIKELQKVEEFQKKGFAQQYQDAILAGAEVTAKIRELGHNPETEDEAERAKINEEMKKGELKDLLDVAQGKGQKAFTVDAFNISSLTKLPKSLLSMLSIRPGEDILEELTRNTDHEDLSPLSRSMLHYKPFIEVDGEYYAFFHSGFEDRIAEIIEADMFSKITAPTTRSKVERRRSDYLEVETQTLLDDVTHPDLSLLNVYYPNPDEEGNALTELDLLLGVDDVLFLVEVKSGAMSDSANRGATEALASSLGALILEGQRQSERAEKYIKSAEEVSFYDQSGKTVVATIKSSNYRKIFRIIVTKEELGIVGANLAQLAVLDPSLSKSMPWHVSIGDLRVVVELFRDKSAEFAHYLEQRLGAADTKKLAQYDEVEHIALYHKYNFYQELPFDDMDRMTYDGSHTQEIDFYFAAKIAGESSEVPAQKISDSMKKLVNALEFSNLPHRFEAVRTLLFLDSKARQEVSKMIDLMNKGVAEGRLRALRMPFTDLSFGLTLSYADEAHWQEEVLRSAAQMQQGNCKKWIIVQVLPEPNYGIGKIELIRPDMFDDEDIANEKERLEARVQKLMAEKKIRSNQICPCGSGERFKNCHGKKG